MIDGGVCRTAPATPGLLIIYFLRCAFTVFFCTTLFNLSNVIILSIVSNQQTQAKPGAALQTLLSLICSFINLMTLCESRLFAAVASDWSKLRVPTINRLCCTQLGDSKSQMKFKSHFWYNSQSNFCGVVIFFYWWSCIWKGLCCSLRSRLVFSIASNLFDHHTDRSIER